MHPWHTLILQNLFYMFRAMEVHHQDVVVEYKHYTIMLLFYNWIPDDGIS
jgi:hypothetical protein